MKICVIGLGRFGYSVAETLAESGIEVLAIDRHPEIISSISDKVTQAICMPITDLESLKAVGVDDVDIAIVGMGKNVEQSILLTALLKKHLNIPMVIARSNSLIHEDILKLVGADKIVFPEHERGVRLAKNLSLPLIDFISITPKFSISQVSAPKSFVGKSIKDLNLRETRRVSCLGVKKGTDVELIDLSYVILEDDQLIFAGDNHYLEALTRL